VGPITITPRLTDTGRVFDFAGKATYAELPEPWWGTLSPVDLIVGVKAQPRMVSTALKGSVLVYPEIKFAAFERRARPSPPWSTPTRAPGQPPPALHGHWVPSASPRRIKRPDAARDRAPPESRSSTASAHGGRMTRLATPALRRGCVNRPIPLGRFRPYDAAELAPVMIPSAVRRLCAKPGALYTTVCLVFVGLHSLNLIGYLYARELSALALPRSTQLLWLTIGTVLMFCALRVLCAFVWSLLIKRPPLPPPYAAARADLPFVTVQIPLRNEELDVVARYSLASAFALHYPPNRLEIQVIDNSDSPECYLPIQRYLNAEAARRRVSAVLLHREGTAGFKARNLNLGLAAARGAFFLVLDADSTVPPDTLVSVLPYFQDPEVGYVQMELRAVNEDANLHHPRGSDAVPLPRYADAR